MRLEAALPLPNGWNGKQHACWSLASLATHDVFCYIDADVVPGPEAIYRMVSELNHVEGDEPELLQHQGTSVRDRDARLHNSRRKYAFAQAAAPTAMA